MAEEIENASNSLVAIAVLFGVFGAQVNKAALWLFIADYVLKELGDPLDHLFEVRRFNDVLDSVWLVNAFVL